jgi:hypothetical protein
MELKLMSVLPGGLIGLFLIICFAGVLGWIPFSQLIIIVYLLVFGFLNANGFDPVERSKQREDWYFPQSPVSRVCIIAGFVLLFMISPFSTKLVMMGVGLWIVSGFLLNASKSTMANQLTVGMPSPMSIPANTSIDLVIPLKNSGNRLENITIKFHFKSEANPSHSFESTRLVEEVYANNDNKVRVTVNVPNPGVYFMTMSAAYQNSQSFTAQEGRGVLRVTKSSRGGKSNAKKPVDGKKADSKKNQ